MAEQGEAYASHVEAELKAEYERTTALNTRAAAITTTSSAFLALVFTLTAVVTGKDFKATDWGARGVVAALVFFVAAELLGLVAGFSRKYTVTALDTLEAMVEEHWRDDEVDARNVVAFTNVKTIGSLREGNNAKAKLLVLAAGLQLIAIAVLIVALAAQLWPLID